MDPNTKGYKMTALYLFTGLQGVFVVVVFDSVNQGNGNQDNSGNAAESFNQNRQQEAERMDW